MKKDKTLSETIKELNTRFDGAVSPLKSTQEYIPSGNFVIDKSIGGGIPRGRITEIYGMEASFKSGLALTFIKQAQSLGLKCLYLDLECSLDKDQVKSIGVDLDKLYVSQLNLGPEVFQVAESLIQTGEIGLVVFDSVSAMTMPAETEGEFGSANIGIHAKMLSQALRKLVALINKTNTAFIFVNQIREKPGVMFGPSTTTSGGLALRFYSSLRLELRKSEVYKDELGNPTGVKIKLKIIKNKMDYLSKELEFDLVFGQGIDNEGSLVDYAISKNIVEKAGAWLKYGDKKFQGKVALVEELRKNEELVKNLYENLV